MAKPRVFHPISFGSLEIPGRLIRSATSEGGSDAEGIPTPELRDIYVSLAEGGCPLIMTGYAFVDRSGQSGPNQNAICDDVQVSHWKTIVDAVHGVSPQAKIAMQIVHGGRQCRPECVPEPLAPSTITNTRTGITPQELTETGIRELITSFAQAAGRVKEAGFDAVQLHMAHGYLISQFLSPHTNRRTDIWGGTPENRRRFALEIYHNVRTEVGFDFPVLIKINATDCLESGLTPEEAGQHCRALADAGIDGIELSAWMVDADLVHAPSRKVNPAVDEEGYFMDAFREIRKAVPFSTPLGVCGGFRSVEAMERMIESQRFDFVSASRPFICEPDLFNQLKAGQHRAICISCNACTDGDRPGVVTCPVREELLPYRVQTGGNR